MKIKQHIYLILIIALMSCNGISKRNEQDNKINRTSSVNVPNDSNIVVWKKNIKYQNIESKKPQQKKETWTIERLYKEEPYLFDTILKNGYNLHFKYYNEKDTALPKFGMMLTLNKRNKIIAILNSLSAHFPQKNLGYIGADFDDYFAFVQSFGSGNPHEMQLLRKKDAKKIVSGFIVDADEKNGILLYNRNYDSLMFYDINNKKDNLIVNLNKSNLIDCMISEFSNNLKIKKVTKTEIFIEITKNNGKKILKKYCR
jgi:hypothetical protein